MIVRYVSTMSPIFKVLILTRSMARVTEKPPPIPPIPPQKIGMALPLSLTAFFGSLVYLYFAEPEEQWDFDFDPEKFEEFKKQLKAK
mmetsp:Transcript_14304/g.20235  ORF Transcript_14304/g.20235 Transcript_14304/m.20235 type:complete len:87 (+) Transcript_14304:36-296(+)